MMLLRSRVLVVSVLAGTLCSCVSTPRQEAVDQKAVHVAFNRDIRPILSDTCYQCHGPHEAARKRDLRFDIKEGLFGSTKEGFALISPGDPSESEIFLRITHEDPEERMPPEDSNKSLNAEQIALVRSWIEEGAPYEGHWAFIPPVKHPAPPVQQRDWLRDDIDAYVLARLETAGLEPSPEADRRTLIRRVTFDLTGLPPTPEEVHHFLADRKPGAYERVVDRLLASPHYGERMALAWLDQSRYADTNGYSIDGGRHMWLWRDWVIQAYNDDKPFDEYVREQIAGDLIENPTDQQLVATGFNRNHMITHEGGTIPEENLANYAFDRVKTTSEALLGLTMACAQCHDHKFDPISQKEYYQFLAYFNEVDDKGLDGNEGRNSQPTFETTTAMRHADVDAIAQEIAAIEKDLFRPQPDLMAAWEDAQRAALAARGVDLQLHSLRTLAAKTPERDPTRLEVLEDGSIFAKRAYSQTYTVSLQLEDSDAPDITGVRIEFYPHADVRDGALGYGEGEREGSFGLHDVSVSAGALASDEIDLPQLIPMARATASYSHPDFPARNVLDPREHNAWSPLGKDREQQHLTLVFERPLRPAETPYLTVMLGMINRNLDLSSPGHFRIFAISGNDDGSELPPDIQEILAVAQAQRTTEQAARIYAYHALHNPQLRPMRTQLDNLRRRLEEMTQPFSTMVMNQAETPRKTHVLVRGDYASLGEEVQPATPAFLPPLPENAAANRLGLANWIVDPDNPLTSRVAVNRMWQLVFGKGLVASSADFGSQGVPPTHPELLDALAVDFVESGWQVKQMMKRLVTSAAYRQQSHSHPAGQTLDPGNTLLWRGPRFRLPGEFIRDSVLQTSGLLVAWVGGASVMPYQPPHLWREISHYGSTPATSQVFVQDEGLNLYRRSMYTYWKRTVPPPAMTVFDAPNREVCTVQRESTNTPLQALVLLNDTQFVEASRAFAERILHEMPDAATDEWVRFAFETVTSRPPDRFELQTLLRAYDQQYVAYQERPDAAVALLAVGASQRDEGLDAAEHAALTAVANLIFNLSEALTRI